MVSTCFAALAFEATAGHAYADVITTGETVAAGGLLVAGALGAVALAVGIIVVIRRALRKR